MTLNRVYLTTHPKLKNSPLLVGSEKSGFVEIEFELGGTLKRPSDNFLVKIGADRAVIAPPESTEGDLWEELLKPGK